MKHHDGAAAAQALILVHGLWMKGWVMAALAFYMKRLGFQVHSFSYHSVRQPVADHALSLQRYVTTLDAQRVHWLGHSLGGRVILRLFGDFPHQAPGRIVTLATPLAPSASAAALKETPWGRWFGGCSLEELNRPATLPPGREVGAIAGRLSVGMGRFITRLPRPNDGAVPVAETRLPGLTDHLVMDVSHSSSLLSREVARQAARFLHQGAFDHAP